MTQDEALTAKLRRIADDLRRLKRKDRRFLFFGSSSHRYSLHRRASEEQILRFERQYEIELPPDYRRFINEIGNGGAGPFYGLVPLERTVLADMDGWGNSVLKPSSPFQFTSPWNLDHRDFPSEEGFDKAYFDPKHIAGLLRLCNYGCGVFINLVVTGEERGYMWTDDRVNDNGLQPSYELGNEQRLTFVDWYQFWLDSKLK